MKNNKIFSSKVSIIVINLAIYTLAIAFVNNTNPPSFTSSTLTTLLIILFIVTSLFIIFVINFVKRKFSFDTFYLKESCNEMLLLNEISKETGIVFSKITDNIFYSSYTHQRFLDSISKEIYLIISTNKVFINIHNKDETVLIYTQDFIEKKIKEVLLKNSITLIA